MPSEIHLREAAKRLGCNYTTLRSQMSRGVLVRVRMNHCTMESFLAYQKRVKQWRKRFKEEACS